MKKRVAMLPVFFVGGGEGGGDAITVQRKKSRDGGEACGEKAMAVIQPYKRRRAAPKARPTEKGNLRGDKGGGERGKPTPAPPKRRGESHAGGAACGEKAMAVTQPYKRRRAAPKARPTEKRNGRL